MVQCQYEYLRCIRGKSGLYIWFTVYMRRISIFIPTCHTLHCSTYYNRYARMYIIITYLVVPHKLTYIVSCRAYYLSTILSRVFVCILLQYVTVLYTVSLIYNAYVSVNCVPTTFDVHYHHYFNTTYLSILARIIY